MLCNVNTFLKYVLYEKLPKIISWYTVYCTFETIENTDDYTIDNHSKIKIDLKTKYWKTFKTYKNIICTKKALKEFEAYNIIQENINFKQYICFYRKERW